MILGSGPWNGISETCMLASYLFFYLFTYKDGDILYWWKDKQILVSLELESRTPITVVSKRTLEDEKRLNRENMKKKSSQFLSMKHLILKWWQNQSDAASAMLEAAPLLSTFTILCCFPLRNTGCSQTRSYSTSLSFCHKLDLLF